MKFSPVIVFYLFLAQRRKDAKGSLVGKAHPANVLLGAFASWREFCFFQK
jgi:hypothetical protein